MKAYTVLMVTPEDIANGVEQGMTVWLVEQQQSSGLFALSEDSEPDCVVLDLAQVRGLPAEPVSIPGTETAAALPAESVHLVDKPKVNPKDLVGQSKVDMSLVPQSAIVVEAHAMMDGAAKYGAYNWRENPVLMRVYLSAAMRHIGKFLDGEDVDTDSEVHHLGHARACLGIVYDAITVGNVIDDRPPPAPTAQLMTDINHKILERRK